MQYFIVSKFVEIEEEDKRAVVVGEEKKIVKQKQIDFSKKIK